MKHLTRFAAFALLVVFAVATLPTAAADVAPDAPAFVVDLPADAQAVADQAPFAQAGPHAVTDARTQADVVAPAPKAQAGFAAAVEPHLRTCPPMPFARVAFVLRE